jgi:hypothetical protein
MTRKEGAARLAAELERRVGALRSRRRIDELEQALEAIASQPKTS